MTRANRNCCLAPFRAGNRSRLRVALTEGPNCLNHRRRVGPLRDVGAKVKKPVAHFSGAGCSRGSSVPYGGKWSATHAKSTTLLPEPLINLIRCQITPISWLSLISLKKCNHSERSHRRNTDVIPNSVLYPISMLTRSSNQLTYLPKRIHPRLVIVNQNLGAVDLLLRHLFLDFFQR